MLKQILRFSATVFLIALPFMAGAHEYKAGEGETLLVTHPAVNATVAANGVGYLGVVNSGPEADRLVSASLDGDAVARVEIHTMSMDGGIMKMRPLPEGLSIPAGATVTLSPMGTHLMLMGLKSHLVEGSKLPGTLTFEKAGTVPVEFSVEPVGGHDKPDHEGHDDMGGMHHHSD